MKKRKGIISTILIILGALCYLTGVILYFLDTGMFLFMSRGFIILSHNISGLALGPFVAYHFYLNRKIYLSEIKNKPVDGDRRENVNCQPVLKNIRVMEINLLKKFTTFEIVVIALMAAVGIAAKPFISYLAHLVTGVFFIPAGALAGGLYMSFVIIGAAIVGKPFTATLVCIVQAIIAIVSGTYGSHGIISILTYILPGIVMDSCFYLFKSYADKMLSCFTSGMLSNICGTLSVNYIFFRLPFIPLTLSLLLAGLSGGLGGLLSWKIIKKIAENNLIKESLLCRKYEDKKQE